MRTRCMELVFSSGKMAENTKVCSKMESLKAKESSHSKMAESKKELG